MMHFACTCCLISAVALAEMAGPAERYLAVKDSNPRLFELSQQAGAELDAIALRDYVVPNRARRREMADWASRKRAPNDAELIANTVEEAFAQESCDWALLTVALGAARRGVVDERVLKVAREIVRSSARLPDDAMMAVGAAQPLLALSGTREDIDLLVKAASRAFVGIDAKNAEFVSSHRELLCQGALQALFLYAPLDKAISALKRVRNSFRSDSKGFDGFIRGSAESYLDQLARVRRGEAVQLPMPAAGEK